MSPIHDAALVVRAASDGAFAADSIISVDLDGTPLRGMALEVVIPAVQGSLPTLSIDVHASSTSAAASTDLIIATRELGVQTAATIANSYIIPFSTRKRSVAFAFRIGGGSTPSFSNVLAWIVQGVGQDWTRTVEFR